MKKIPKKLVCLLLNARIALIHTLIDVVSSKEKYFYLFAFAVCFIEMSLFSRMQFFGVKPNLLIFLLTFYCFYFNYDLLKVCLFSFTCGVLKDFCSGNILGTNILIFIIIGSIISYIAKRSSRFNWTFILLFFALAVIIEGLVYNIIQGLIFGNTISLFILFFRILLLELIYTLILFFAFFKLIKKCVIDKLV